MTLKSNAVPLKLFERAGDLPLAWRTAVLRFENDVDRFVNGSDKDFLFDLSLTGYQVRVFPRG